MTPLGGGLTARICVAVVLGLGLSPLAAPAQEAVFVGTELDRYQRALELAGRSNGAWLVFRPLSPRNLGLCPSADTAHPWQNVYPVQSSTRPRSLRRVTLLEPKLHTTYLSSYARSANDGALWSGKGLSGEIQAGGRGVFGPITATYYPTIFGAVNQAFRLPPGFALRRSSFAYWRPDIDWPFRFGDDAFREIDWGQSSVRLDLGAFTAGIGTENLWWGPAVRHPILMSNTAPGFPHLDLGTGRPVQTPIGRAETRLLWGQLSESAYFDTLSINDRRFFVALTAALEPKWLPGLTLGLARTFQLPWSAARLEDLFVVFQTVFQGAFYNPDNPSNPGGTDDRDQALSLYGRWLLPESGFEVYGEWARTDHSTDLRDLVLEPEHSRAYLLGLGKAMVSGTRIWSFRAELTQLERPPANADLRGGGGFYTHNLIQQGYTHRGQMLGAAIGPGATSRYLSLDRYSPAGRIGAYAEWVRYDNDLYYERFSTPEAHDVELTVGVSALRFVGQFNVGAVLAVSRELNRYFERGNDVTNLRLETTVGWRPW